MADLICITKEILSEFGIQGASSRHPLHFFIVSLLLLKGIKRGEGGIENL